MALIKCSECGKEISDKARQCSNCGVRTNNEKTYQKKLVKWRKLHTLILIIGIVVLGGAITTPIIISNVNSNDEIKEKQKNNVEEPTDDITLEKKDYGTFNLNDNFEFVETVFYLVGVNDICASYRSNEIFYYSSQSVHNEVREKLNLSSNRPFMSYECYTDITSSVLDDIKKVPGLKVVDNEIKNYYIKAGWICQSYSCDVITQDWIYFDYNFKMLEVMKISISKMELDWDKIYPGVGFRDIFNNGSFMKNITKYQVDRPNILGDTINGRKYDFDGYKNELEVRHFYDESTGKMKYDDYHGKLDEEKCEEYNLKCDRW